MPLPSPQPRAPEHTRQVTFQGYRREDGLWDIEGEMKDTKSLVFDLQEEGVSKAGTLDCPLCAGFHAPPPSRAVVLLPDSLAHWRVQLRQRSLADSAVRLQAVPNLESFQCLDQDADLAAGIARQRQWCQRPGQKISMDSDVWWAALGLMLVVEGLFPFISPTGWRNRMQQLLALQDGQIRFFGLALVLVGLLLLWWP